LWGAQAASLHLPGSLPASFVQDGLGYSTRVSASYRDRQAGSLCSPAIRLEAVWSQEDARASLSNIDSAHLRSAMPELAEVEYFRRQSNAGIGHGVIKIALHV